VDGECSEEVLNMATKTKALPMIDMNINGTLSAQFMITMVSGCSG